MAAQIREFPDSYIRLVNIDGLVCEFGPCATSTPINFQSFNQGSHISGLFKDSVKDSTAEFRAKKSSQANLDAHVDGHPAVFRPLCLGDLLFGQSQVFGCGIGIVLYPLSHLYATVLPAAFTFSQLGGKIVDSQK